MNQAMLTSKIIDIIHFLYGTEHAAPVLAQLERLLKQYTVSQPPGDSWLTEKDIFLITYANSVCEKNRPGLESFRRFYEDYLQEIIRIVHFLPFFPWTSDDGFSVMDYRKIDPGLGDWDDVRSLAKKVDLCFDFVLNHCSSQSDYFQGFLADDPHYKNFFITEEPEADYSTVLRPRTSPLFHEFDSASGPRKVWTTFSRDQVDLNFQNPAVLLEMIDLLLFL